MAVCLDAIEPDSYVYTDHYEGGNIKRCQFEHVAPFRIEHYITTLMPVEMARLGFDTTLPHMEDTEFYLRARKAGFKPIYVPRPLWHYRKQHSLSGLQHRAAAIKGAEKVLRTRYA